MWIISDKQIAAIAESMKTIAEKIANKSSSTENNSDHQEPVMNDRSESSTTSASKTQETSSNAAEKNENAGTNNSSNEKSSQSIDEATVVLPCEQVEVESLNVGTPVTVDTPMIIRSYWSSDKEGKDKVTKAHLEETVYFHIETQALNGKNIKLQLYDRDTLGFDDDLFAGNTIEKSCKIDDKGKGVLELKLPIDWTDDLKGEKKLAIFSVGYRKLYWRIIADGTLESQDLETFLEVYQSNTYLYVEPGIDSVPQIYTTKGEQITIFTEYIEEQVQNKIKEEVINLVTSTIEESINQKAHRYAIGMLSQGYLVTQGREIVGGRKTSRGTVRKLGLIHYNVDGVSTSILRANEINYKTYTGKKVSTNGVDPYKMFKDMNIGCKLRVLGYFNKTKSLIDIFMILKGAMETTSSDMVSMPIPKLGPQLFVDLVSMMAYVEFRKIDDALEEYRREKLEEAKAEGLEAVESLVKSWKWWNGVAKANGKELDKDEIEYKTEKITTETAMKINQGEFKTIDEIQSYNISNDDANNVVILYRNQYDSVRNERVDIIETFFIKMEEEYEY